MTDYKAEVEAMGRRARAAARRLATLSTDVKDCALTAMAASIRDHAAEIRAALDARRPSEAQMAFSRALEDDRSQARARFGMAAIEARGGQAAAARRHLEQLLTYHPEHAEGWNLMASLRLQAGEGDGALEAVERALEADPFFPEALANRGLIALRREDPATARRMLERGVDVISESDDIAGIDGPFWPPRLMKQYLWPPIQHVVKMAHRKGVAYTKHSDGNLMPILEEFIEFCGFDGINPIEPQCMDLAEVKRRFGQRVYIKGNVDITWVIPYGTENDVRHDVRRAIDQGAKGGGFILAESNSFHPHCKFENILTYVDEAHKYGVYPCGKVEAEG